jgi:para-aminobenzoate synthetase/4-amino-4-deoxychorismate lyase
VFLRHKTTHREVYERRRRTGVDDTILVNDRGEVTESCAANVVVEINGRRWTPPASAGLLPGVFRAHLLARGEIAERRLTPGDLARAERVWLINSVRGWIDVLPGIPGC